MLNQNNLYLLMQDDDDNFLDHSEQMQSFCDRQKSKYDESSQCNSFISKNDSRFGREMSKRNHNLQLQDLLESDTVIYANTSSLSMEKKRLFTDLSFFSKDCTQDLSNQEGYHELMNKMQFQRSRNRELNHELAQQKQRAMKKYLKDLMDEFKELSEENKLLRQVYRKQAGGGYKQKLQKNISMKQQDFPKNKQTLAQYPAGSQTPRNNIKNGRKSIAALSISASQQPNLNSYNSCKPNVGKDKVFFGVGNQNFCQTNKMQTINIKPQNKLHICQSSINITNNGESTNRSPKRHKRRQSQLTQRKEYPGAGRQGNGDDFLLILDGGQMSFDNEMTGRMSQPGKMPKQRYAKQVEKNSSYNNWVDVPSNTPSGLNSSVERNSLRVSISEPQLFPIATNTKNIFIEFLQTLLLQEKISYTEMSQQMNEGTIEEENNLITPSYKNIKFIEQLEKEIMTKNLKLRQLQEVINVFKSEIEEIIGTDIKVINELMIQLLQVKGKYLEMQQKVNGITGLKNELQIKETMKQNIINEIKSKIEKKKKQAQHKQQPIDQLEINFELFPIPQSIKTLFDLLSIKLPINSKPIQYLSHIKDLPKNKDLFQAFDSKKRVACNMKIKEVIDQIRQGRKKFNEVIKIYEGRIIKLQQKIHKYKNQKPKSNGN